MSQLSQGTLETFYMEIKNYFSLILSNLRNGSRAPEEANALIDTYRDRAIDAFIRGVNGDCTRLLVAQT